MRRAASCPPQPCSLWPACWQQLGVPVSQPRTAGRKRVVLERGHLAQNRPWQLAASEQGGKLGLYLENPSGGDYSDAVGFTGDPGAGFWMEGSGPGSSVFYYGPVPAAAVTVRLSAPGRAPIRVPARLIPARDGLPRGRFFIVDPPGPPSVSWNVTLLDSAGHEVPFADF